MSTAISDLRYLLSITYPEVDFTGAALSPGLPEVVEAIEGASVNTGILLTLKGPTASVLGTEPFKYRRLDLGVLFRGFTPKLYVPLSSITSTADLTPYIQSTYGVTIYPEELEEVAVDSSVLPTTVTLTAKPGALLIIGTVNITLEVGAIDLASLNYDLGSFPYPAGTSGVIQGPVLSFQFNGSSIEPTLQQLQTNEATTLDLVNKINQLSGKTFVWLEYEVTDWNLWRSTVVYNGPLTDAYGFTPNSAFANFVVILLSDYCKNIDGYLTLYYN